MAKETHPDLARGKEAEFLRIRKAYDILTNKPGAAADQTDYTSSRQSRSGSSQQRYSFYQNRHGQSSSYEERYARYRATGVGENEKLYGPHWRIVVGIAIVSATAGMALLNLFEVQRDKFMAGREAAFAEAEMYEQQAISSRTKLPPKREVWDGER